LEQHNNSPTTVAGRSGIRDLLGFFAFSHGWTWLFWAIAALLGASIWEMPGVIFFYIGGAGVMLGGLVMSGVVYGRNGPKELGRRIADPRLIPGRWWAVILLTFPALTLIAAALVTLTGASPEPFNLFHFLQNLCGEFLGISAEVRQIQLILMVVMAVGVVLWWGPKTLRRDGQMPQPAARLEEQPQGIVRESR
jgi:hypothetical protein